MIGSIHLPTLNACLNFSCAVLLVIGILFIRARKIEAHKKTMGLAVLVSVAFLISYLTYHFLYGSTPFEGTGWVRTLYFTILISHTILAIVVVPLVIRTVLLILRNQVEKHKAIARWTFPIWLYVSVTGVVVYWMLYQMTWS